MLHALRLATQTIALTGVTGGLGSRVLRHLQDRRDLRVLVPYWSRAPEGVDVA